jgi:integron integrase
VTAERPAPEAVPPSPGGRPPKLLDRVREAIRVRHYSRRTEEAYLAWIKRFIFFHGVRHPAEMGAAEINAFLTHLAVDGHVSASTQNQAFSALLFLYQKVLEVGPGQIAGVVRAKRPRRLPVVLTRAEVRAVLAGLDGVPRLVSQLLYGAGLRILDALRLRVHDLEFTRREILVRDGKGHKDRVTMLPDAAGSGLREHLTAVRALSGQDRADGVGVYLPEALVRKYSRAPYEWGWYYVFPAPKRGVDPRDGQVKRHHLSESLIQKAVKAAAARAGLSKPVTPHVFRHAFATHLLEDGYDIRTVQELLGHAHVETTMVYTHVLNRGGRGVRSPLDERG